jgi:hypothetical protein
MSTACRSSAGVNRADEGHWLPGLPLGWFLGLAVGLTLGLVAVHLGASADFGSGADLRPLACGLLAVCAPIAGLLGSGAVRSWAFGRAAVVVLFNRQTVSGWIFLRCLVLVFVAYLIAAYSFEVLWLGGVLLGSLLGGAILVGVVFDVGRTLLGLRILTLRRGRVGLWGAGVAGQVRAATAVGERQLEVSFHGGGQETLWLPKLMSPAEGESNDQLLAVQFAVNLILVECSQGAP